MALLDIQRRLAEIGRIRIGEQVPIGKSGKTRPAKLDTFRLTSPNQHRIQAAANLYGGTPRPWQAPAGPQWEVITETAALPVIVPPADVGFSQHYELWSGGGCLRRCDGNYATYITDANPPTLETGECLCDPENRECKPHTRLSVMLRDLPGIGLWRLDTQGFYAAAELKGAVDVITTATRLGVMIPAQLRLEQRMIKRPGKTTRRFAVAVLDPEISPGQLAGIHLPDEIRDGVHRGELMAVVAPPAAPAIDGAARFTPVPIEDTPPEDIPSIAEQAAARTPRRKGGQAPIPRTGIAPRTTAQAATPPTPAEAEQPELPTSPGRRPPRLKHPSEMTPEELRNPLAALADNPPPDDEPPRLITAAQLTKLSIQLNEAGLGGKTDEARQARHDFCATIIGRPIASAKDLTMAEAGDIIDILENDRQDSVPPDEM